MEKGYYKPRKTLINKSDTEKQPNKKTKTPKPKVPSTNPKISPTKSKTKDEPYITGGYSKRITYPIDNEVSGLQKGGGKIGGYVKPKTMSHNPMKKIVWVLLAIFVIAIIFAIFFFTDSIDKLKIGGIGLDRQDLEMKISNVQIEKDSVDLKIDIDAKGEELVGVKIIIDDGVNFDVFKIELTKEEIEKGEIHLDLIDVDGDKVTKILISPIFDTKERKGVVGSIEESYIPRKDDFVSKKYSNNYDEPQDVNYPYNGSSLQNQTQNNNGLNQTLTNQIQNQSGLNQTLNNQTDDNQSQLDQSFCTDNDLLDCYKEVVYQYNTCSNIWIAKQECTSEELCMINRCIPREEIVPECGNGILEVGEYCEEGNLVGETCESFGYISGTLTCNHRCVFDLRDCLEPEIDCVSNASSACYDGNVHWYDSCDVRGEIKEDCQVDCDDSQGEAGCLCLCASDMDCVQGNICEECMCVLEVINEPCWFIENNQCQDGADEVTCDRDIIHTSLEACEQDLIPEGCFPLEIETYHCIKIEENDPGYNTIIQGETTCGHCINSNPGEVVISGTDYYCKCPIPAGV